MDQSRVSKSRIRIVVGSLLVLGCFFWAIYFSFAVPFGQLPPVYARITIWGSVIVVSLLLFLGLLLLAESVDSQKMVIGFILYLVWSIGLLAIPVPEGYGEGVLGIYFLILIVALWLYARYVNSKKKLEPKNIVGASEVKEKKNTMPEERELSEEEKRLYLKGGLVTVIIGSVIMLPGGWLVTNVVVNILRLGPDNVSLLTTFRAIMALAYPICFLPVAILVAFVIRWIWKKSSLLANIAILCGLSGEFVVILIAIVTVFDAVLPGLPVTVQAPLMALSLGIALLAIGETAKIRPIRNFIEKSFE